MTPILLQRQSAEHAFERLYRSHVQDVYRYALMLVRNRDDAEDVVQTTFLKAYRAFQRGDRPRHPRRWLITIAHNTCGTRLRDASRRPREVALDDHVVESIPPVDDDVDVRELVRAVGALSFNQRAALVMRELEGRTYAEIADVLELSTSAVETLLFRARRALREQLEGSLTCGEAERALSLQLDDRLSAEERPRLRAHLRECSECASLARRQRARRAALRSLGPLPLPASLATWGGGAIAGTGVAVKVAALLAVGIAAVGTAHEGIADSGRAQARVAQSAEIVPARSTPALMRPALVAPHAATMRRVHPPRTAGHRDAPPQVAVETQETPAAPESASPPSAQAAAPATVAAVRVALPAAPVVEVSVELPVAVETPAVALPPLPVEVGIP